MKVSERLKREREFIVREIGETVICDRCKCTLGSFAEKCEADLVELCPGFMAVENCKARFKDEATADKINQNISPPPIDKTSAP